MAPISSWRLVSSVTELSALGEIEHGALQPGQRSRDRARLPDGRPAEHAQQKQRDQRRLQHRGVRLGLQIIGEHAGRTAMSQGL